MKPMPNYENTDTQLLEAIAIAAHHQLIAWDTAAGEPRLPAWHEATPDQQIVMRRNVRDLLLGAKPMDPRHPLFGEVVREMAKHFHITEEPVPDESISVDREQEWPCPFCHDGPLPSSPGTGKVEDPDYGPDDIDCENCNGLGRLLYEPKGHGLEPIPPAAPPDLEAHARRKKELDSAELAERLTHLNPAR